MHMKCFAHRAHTHIATSPRGRLNCFQPCKFWQCVMCDVLGWDKSEQLAPQPRTTNPFMSTTATSCMAP